MRISRASIAALLAGALFAAAPAQALPEPATLEGRLSAPDGKPAAGFLVIVVDAFSGEEFGGNPTAADGSFRVRVPVGSRYRWIAVIDPAGQRLAIEPEREVDVPVPGSYELAGATYQMHEAARRRPGGEPWYRTAGGIAGLTAGGLVLLVLAFEPGSSEEPVASPFSP